MDSLEHGTIRLRPRRHQHYISRSGSVFMMDEGGMVQEETEYGLRIRQTRTISKYRYLINGKVPEVVCLSAIQQHSWMGYYMTAPPGATQKPSQKTIELRLTRLVGHGLHEEVDLTNYTQEKASFTLDLEVAADFVDQSEIGAERKVHGRYSQQWREDDGVAELVFDYKAQRHYDEQGDQGSAEFHQSLTVRIEHADTKPLYSANGRISFQIELQARGSWHACLNLIPAIGNKELKPLYGCKALATKSNEFDRKREIFLANSTSFDTPRDAHLSVGVARTIQQSKSDLADLRMHQYDRDHGWVPAAGVPEYVALFGRDTLITAWSSALLTDELMRGTLPVLAEMQATRDDPWRDEQPGKMLHQASDGPLAVLNYRPFHRYYGTLTAPGLFPYVLGLLWERTGDRGLVAPLIEPALKALRWHDTGGDLNGDGFSEYLSRSKKGLQNQGWKDSGDAIVYEDGSQVKPPIAPCEEQGYLYASKIRMAELLSWFDREDEAQALFRQASELRKRFNEAFWIPDAGFFALGLDGQRRQIRAISSNPGHLLGSGIVDDSLARQTADRLMQDDLFSGWGVRTLSTTNPAYDPFSYQRGSVWPVENGMFVAGFERWGFFDHMERLSRSLFEAAGLFEHYRLPEVFSGHPRDAAHPFPAVYLKANWPQAWSAASVFNMISGMTGACPYAPLNALFVDPHLPEWLPELTVTNLHVGKSAATIRFCRNQDGQSDFDVREVRGDLKIIRRSQPWLARARSGARFKEALHDLVGS